MWQFCDYPLFLTSGVGPRPCPGRLRNAAIAKTIAKIGGCEAKSGNDFDTKKLDPKIPRPTPEGVTTDPAHASGANHRRPRVPWLEARFAG
jgi:hypothetical protein